MRRTGTSRPKSIFARFQPPARYSGSAARNSAVLASSRPGSGKQNMLVAYARRMAGDLRDAARVLQRTGLGLDGGERVYCSVADSLASATEIFPPTDPV